MTKYRYRQFKVSKAIYFFVVNCDLCFDSLLQIIVASSVKSLFYKSRLYGDCIQLTSAKRERADSFGFVSRPSKQQKIAAVAAVTTSGQVSQANVGRLISCFLSEGLLLLFQGSNLSKSRRPGASKNNERDSRIHGPLTSAGTWKIPNKLHYNSLRWGQSFFALNIPFGVRQFPCI